MAVKQQDSAAKWLAMMQSPTTQQNYVNGIQAYQGNPMAAAADAEQRYLAGVQDAVNSGRMRDKLLSTPVSTWKTNATTKGAQRLAQGAQAASQKVVAHFQKWNPIYQQAAAAAAALPKGGLANAMARVQAVYTIMKQGAGKSAA